MIQLSKNNYRILQGLSRNMRKRYIEKKIAISDEGILFKNQGREYMANNEYTWCPRTGEIFDDIHLVISFKELDELAAAQQRRNKSRENGYVSLLYRLQNGRVLDQEGEDIDCNIDVIVNYTKEQGGFVMAAFDSCEQLAARFPGLNNFDLARLLYLGTFADRDKGRLQNGKGDVLDRQLLAKKLKLNAKGTRELLHRFMDAGILSEHDGAFFMSKDVFYSGAKKRTSSIHRVYKRPIRKLFEARAVRSIGQLSIIYLLLPFMNSRTNIVCSNPKEMDVDLLQPFSIDEIAQLLGYSNTTKFKAAMISLELDGEPVFQFVPNPNDSRKKCVLLNPCVVFSSDVEHLQMIETKFNQERAAV